MRAVGRSAAADGKFMLGALGPHAVFLVLVFLVPFVYMVWLSFTDLSFALPGRSGAFVGLSNYRRALGGDPLFWQSVLRSVKYALLCAVPQTVAGLAVAEWLSSREQTRRALTPLLSLPVLLPAVVVGLLWKLLLQGEFGALSYLLREWGLLGDAAILSNTSSIMLTLAAVDMWQWMPFVVLVFVAVRLTLPDAPMEAARLDGANSMRIFRDITLPSMLPIAVVVLLLRALDSFREFDKVFILTGGGPGGLSEMSSIYIWRMAFKRWDMGYGAALCVLVYLIILLGVQIFFRLSGQGVQR